MFLLFCVANKSILLIDLLLHSGLEDSCRDIWSRGICLVRLAAAAVRRLTR